MSDKNIDISTIIPELLMKHPAVRSVVLAGSRMRGNATDQSDWDFSVEVTDFVAVSVALPILTNRLKPLSQLWDPLSRHACYMIILRGPIKVDIIFNRLQQQRPPWIINSDTIAQVNSHFWDWILWIAGKEISGRKNMVSDELKKMYVHLLEPLGCARSPNSVEEAVVYFVSSFRQQESLLHTKVDPALEIEVIKYLRRMGFQV